MSSGEPPGESPDPGGLDELSPAECWDLLATQPVGRVAVSVGHYPLAFLVNYAVRGNADLYRTGVGTKLYAIHRSNVTFEVDAIDPVHHTGWSVMVKGVAQELSTTRDCGPAYEAERGGATPWAPGNRDHLI